MSTGSCAGLRCVNLLCTSMARWWVRSTIKEISRTASTRRVSFKRRLPLRKDPPDVLFETDREGRYLNVWMRSPELLVASREALLGRTVR